MLIKLTVPILLYEETKVMIGTIIDKTILLSLKLCICNAQ